MGRFAGSSGRAMKIALIVAISLLLLFFGVTGWPGLHWDASFFAPVVTNIANGKGWTFGGYSYFLIYRGNNIYDFHGIIQPLLYGSLLKAATCGSLILWMSVVNVVTFLAYCLAFELTLSRNSSVAFYFPVLLAIIPAVICLGLQGRPEQLLPLIILIPFLLKYYITKDDLYVISYPFMTLLAAGTSPLPGAIYGYAVLVSLVAKDYRASSLRRVVAYFAIGSAIALIFFLLLFHFFVPFSPLEWIGNTGATGGETAYVEIPKTFNFRAGRWGYTFPAPACNLIYVLFIIAWLCQLVTRRKWMALLMLAIPLYPSLTFLGDYGYAPFVPLIICILIEFGKADFFQIPEAAIHTWTRRACLAMSLVYVYVLILYSLIALDNYRLSADLPGLKSYVAMIASKSSNLDQSSLVAYSDVITPSLVALSDFNLDPITLTPRSVNSEPLGAGFSPASVASKEIGWMKQIEGILKKDINYYFIQQKYPYVASDLPSSISFEDDSFDLISSSWKSWNPLLYRLPMPKSTPARYAVAIYKRRV
jgi:hypothetical protein